MGQADPSTPQHPEDAPAQRGRRVRPGVLVAVVMASLLVGGGLVALGVLLGGGGGEQAARGEAPRPARAQEEPPASGDAAEPVALVGLGELAADDGVTFRVLSIDSVDKLALDLMPDLRPGRDEKLVLAEVVWRNDTAEDLDIFCGENSATLLDVDDVNYPVEADSTYGEGSPACVEVLERGDQRTETLAFLVPKGRKVSGIALWNGDASADPTGNSYVVALLDFELEAPPPDEDAPGPRDPS